MDIKINLYEIIFLVVVAVYFKNAAIPYELWGTEGLCSTEAMIVKILSFSMVLLILIPLIVLYNGLKPSDA